jgi:TonB family protein
MTGMVMLSNLVAWSLQVTLLVGAAFAALALLRIELPALRHAFLRVVLAVCLLLPFVQSAQPASEPPTRGTAISDLAFAPAGELTATPRPPSPVQLFDTYAPPTALGVIAAGVLVRFCWIAAGVWRLRRLRRAGTVVVGPEFDELARAIGTRATLRSLAGLGQPATFGFRDPVVLLPASLAREPRDIQLAVVAHELWHVRRGDWLWTVVEEALRAVFWWHPAIWILLSRIQGTREEVVDRLAIEATGSRRTYVDALLTYAGESPLCGSTAFGRRRHLIQRLMLISKEAVMSARRVVICGAMLAVVIAGSGWYAVQAFPMQAVSPIGVDEMMTESPGPVEQRARPVTPENPIPRRTWHVPAAYPGEAAALDWRGISVTLRVTIDEIGNVAEARYMGITVARMPGGQMRLATSDTPARSLIESRGRAGLEWAVQQAPPEQRDQVRSALFATLQSAVTAVGQWRYDPPADGPISFTVHVPVGPQLSAAAAAASAAPSPGPGSEPTRARPGFDAPRQDLGADGALRVGGNIKAPTKIRHVNPEYPPDARAAGVQGVVIIECRIEPDGTVSDVHVLRSIPMLDEAAIQAVQQWEFTPTLLNGVPMPVIMTVTVNFTLQ